MGELSTPQDSNSLSLSQQVPATMAELQSRIASTAHKLAKIFAESIFAPSVEKDPDSGDLHLLRSQEHGRCAAAIVCYGLPDEIDGSGRKANLKIDGIVERLYSNSKIRWLDLKSADLVGSRAELTGRVRSILRALQQSGLVEGSLHGVGSSIALAKSIPESTIEPLVSDVREAWSLVTKLRLSLKRESSAPAVLASNTLPTPVAAAPAPVQAANQLSVPAPQPSPSPGSSVRPSEEPRKFSAEERACLRELGRALSANFLDGDILGQVWETRRIMDRLSGQDEKGRQVGVEDTISHISALARELANNIEPSDGESDREKHDRLIGITHLGARHELIRSNDTAAIRKQMDDLAWLRKTFVDKPIDGLIRSTQELIFAVEGAVCLSQDGKPHTFPFASEIFLLSERILMASKMLRQNVDPLTPSLLNKNQKSEVLRFLTVFDVMCRAQLCYLGNLAFYLTELADHETMRGRKVFAQLERNTIKQLLKGVSEKLDRLSRRDDPQELKTGNTIRQDLKGLHPTSQILRAAVSGQGRTAAKPVPAAPPNIFDELKPFLNNKDYARCYDDCIYNLTDLSSAFLIADVVLADSETIRQLPESLVQSCRTSIKKLCSALTLGTSIGTEFAQLQHPSSTLRKLVEGVRGARGMGAEIEFCKKNVDELVRLLSDNPAAAAHVA